jgi:hypothetical protein
MMANDVTKESFDAILLPEKNWRLTDHHVGEYVYEMPLSTRPHIVIKVFTSVSKKTDNRRRKGKDAIRICAVDIKADRGVVKSVKVLRVPTWRNNLKSAILGVFNTASKRAKQFNL